MKSAERLLLAAIRAAGAERSLNGVMHILKGKRSSQTIQDVRFFRCEQVTASLKDAPDIDFFQLAASLKKRGYIETTVTGAYYLTTEGIHYLVELDKEVPFPPAFQGMPYEWHSIANYFWQRLRLLVQTISNLQNDIRTFQPVSYDYTVQYDVKIILYHSSFKTGLLSKQLYKEMESVLAKFSNEEAELFVHRLTSSFSAGKTYTQLAAELEKDELHTYLLQRGIIHEMIRHAESDHQSWPVLAKLLPVIPEQTSVTSTAAKTYEYIKAGNMLEEIAELRQLKPATIEDHIVEIALHDSGFDPSGYIDNNVIAMVADKAAQLGTTRLKTIKDHLPEEISYFHIRLALAATSSQS